MPLADKRFEMGVDQQRKPARIEASMHDKAVEQAPCTPQGNAAWRESDQLGGDGRECFQIPYSRGDVSADQCLGTRNLLQVRREFAYREISFPRDEQQVRTIACVRLLNDLE